MISVNTIQAGTVFAWFMLGMVLRRIVMIAIGINAQRGKPIPPGTRVPEDNKLVRGNVEATATTSNQIEFTTSVRVNKTINNDSENDPYFLILLLATAVFSDTKYRSTRTIIYGLIYLVARICYAVAYIKALQPWRTLIFGVGLVVTLACSLDLVITMSLLPN